MDVCENCKFAIKGDCSLPENKYCVKNLEEAIVWIDEKLKNSKRLSIDFWNCVFIKEVLKDVLNKQGE